MIRPWATESLYSSVTTPMTNPADVNADSADARVAPTTFGTALVEEPFEITSETDDPGDTWAPAAGS